MSVVVRPMREATSTPPIASSGWRSARSSGCPIRCGSAATATTSAALPADPASAFVAERDGEVVGSNLATRGAARLLRPAVRPTRPVGRRSRSRLHGGDHAALRRLGDDARALFTFAESAKHVALYGKFGFHPRFLTAVMARPVSTAGARADRRLRAVGGGARGCLADARRLTGTLFDGLDVGSEITR
jgi:hypothetical protein